LILDDRALKIALGIEDVEVERFPDGPSILYGDKVGILMKEKLFEPLCEAFHLFQRYPYVVGDCIMRSKSPYQILMKLIRNIRHMPEDEVVVWPLDIETPWAGGFGIDVWEIFFNTIKAQHLEDIFMPISDALDFFKDKAKRSKKPYRKTTKWSGLDIQDKHMADMYKIRPITVREKWLWSVASTSDALAAFERKINGKEKPIILPGEDMYGEKTTHEIGYNQSIIEIQLAAKEALVHEKTFLSALKEIPIKNSLLIQRMIKFAEKKGL